jgi:two-component system, NtrC family, sensor histidine kinase HydH
VVQLSAISRSTVAPFALARRLGWATAARLALVATLFVVVVAINVRAGFDLSTFTIRVALITIAVAFALSALYGWVLRTGKHLAQLVTVQLVLDQATWSVVVYLSGGVQSGATSFYGISCLLGAILAGFRGATTAAGSALAFYLLLVWGLTTGWIPAPSDQPKSVYQVSTEDLTYSVVVTGLMLIVVTLLAGNLSERLRVAGGQLVKAEARANQAEREALLGRLAAALAHEIRNPLSSISGSVRILSSTPGMSGEDRKLCSIIEREAWRLDDLVSDMVNLTKPQKPEMCVVDVSSVAEDVCSLARHSGRGAGDVAVIYDGEKLLPIVADPGMVRQMLWNLVRNAVQASQASDVVRVAVHLVDGEVVVEVVDHGSGISDDAKPLLFDAFYTTRSQGTGIGLAVVKRIVDEHGWSIAVLDTDPRGATFCVNMGELSQDPLGTVPVKAKGRWTLSPTA